MDDQVRRQLDWGLDDLESRGIDVEVVISKLCLFTMPNAVAPLTTQDILRGLRWAKSLKEQAPLRRGIPSMRGGRPNQVAIYAEVAKTKGIANAVLRATQAGLSLRSIYRLKKLASQAN